MAINYYSKILNYLKQFEGDGQLPKRVDNLFDGIMAYEWTEILNELADQGLIKLYKAYGVKDISNASYDHVQGVFYPNNDFGNDNTVTYYAKLTFKGSNHLKEDFRLNKEGYNITIGDGSTANLIVGSPNSRITSELANEKLKTILTQLKGDNDLSTEVKKQAIEIFEKAASEMHTDNAVAQTTIQDILGIGADIVTVAPSVFEFLKLLVN